MAPRKRNEPASWEVDADKPKPEGSTRIRRSYCAKELATREYDLELVNPSDCCALDEASIALRLTFSHLALPPSDM